MQQFRLKAFAKINLGLKVIGRRNDGFHELRTVYQSISLADTVDVEMKSAPPSVHLESSGFAVPIGKDNLAAKAAAATLEELKLRRAVSIRLIKKIPPGSGLGGASSDAAAVIFAILRLSGKRIAPDALLRMSSGLGSDVPFFLSGGTAVGVGRGEEIYPLPDGPRRWCVLFYPGEGMNTSEAYGLLHAPLLTSPKARHTIELFCGTLVQGTSQPIGNDFEPLIFARFPALAKAKKALLRCGSEMASLTGSGSAVFGVFSDLRKARHAAESLRQEDRFVQLTRFIRRSEFQKQLGL
ncbi:MAG: 4-(cytidine 5'-diphospho)-2-C-methyl-D-erythritol kinase [Acidobacteria bacterium RIFCSPLOWO2_12_FULL_54_10]|nr:MAG: 4-(cytidine 5'-diphospho)-2-C-methyl-D-erythritol kinase [Acidobacteria bacterium RIFCSPLOWO2_12_FULL_54_10]